MQEDDACDVGVVVDSVPSTRFPWKATYCCYYTSINIIQINLITVDVFVDDITTCYGYPH